MSIAGEFENHCKDTEVTRDDLRYLLAMRSAGAPLDEEGDDRLAAHVDDCEICQREMDFRRWTEPALTGTLPTLANARLKIGDRMPDGTVYAGISAATDEPMYATPNDAPFTYTFNQARDYAAKLDVHGHQDWRVPTKSELNVLFQNRAAIGGFDESGSHPARFYLSSSHLSDNHAWGQRFSDGDQFNYFKHYVSSLRCVCGGDPFRDHSSLCCCESFDFGSIREIGWPVK
jgi:hypothetical protein